MAPLANPAFLALQTQFTEDDLAFQEKILYRSGLGDETSVPPCKCYYYEEEYRSFPFVHCDLADSSCP